MYVYESIHAWLVHTAPNIVSCSHAWQLILSRYVTSWFRLRCSEIPRGDSPRPYRQSILRSAGGNTETLNPRGMISLYRSQPHHVTNIFCCEPQLRFVT